MGLGLPRAHAELPRGADGVLLPTRRRHLRLERHRHPRRVVLPAPSEQSLRHRLVISNFSNLSLPVYNAFRFHLLLSLNNLITILRSHTPQ
jgi:hypothetical protein